MTLDLSAALEQITAMHDDNMRLAEIDCENCNHHAIIVVRFDSPESVKCPKCGEVLDLLNDDEIIAEVETRRTETIDLRPGWIPVGDSDGAVTRSARLAGEMVEKYNAAQAANEGADFDVLEDAYLAREDWRHCRIAE